jgi:hypothetical protein
LYIVVTMYLAHYTVFRLYFFVVSVTCFADVKYFLSKIQGSDPAEIMISWTRWSKVFVNILFRAVQILGEKFPHPKPYPNPF